jgi:anti-anti-sigma regulatory factor
MVKNKIVLTEDMGFKDLVNQAWQFIAAGVGTTLVLDFAGVPRLTAPILGALVSIANHFYNRGFTLKVVNLDDNLEEQIEDLELMRYLNGSNMQYHEVFHA